MHNRKEQALKSGTVSRPAPPRAVDAGGKGQSAGALPRLDTPSLWDKRNAQYHDAFIFTMPGVF